MCTAMDDPDSPCNNETQDDILAKIDTRKSNKPLMEKKRRQRINRCLTDLKSLVLEGMKKDPSRYSKLEKADILEMTVRHVQALHRHEGVGCRLGGGGRLLGNGRPAGGDGRTKYRAGFIHCAVEVTRYLSGLSGVPHDLHHRLISHLNTVTASLTCVPGMGHLPGASVAVGGGVVTVAPPPTSRPEASSATTTTDSSTPIPPTLGAPIAVSCMSPPPVLLPWCNGGPILTTSLPTSTGVAIVPARLAPQQTTQLLSSASSSSPASLPQAIQPRPLILPAPPTADQTYASPVLGLHKSEYVSVSQISQPSQNITFVVRREEPSPQETVGSFVSRYTLPPRILPFASSVLTPSGGKIPSSTHGTHMDHDQVSDTSSQAGAPAKQGHAITPVDAPQLSDAIPVPSESQDKITSPSWSAPLGFQVSVKFSNATSPPVFSAPVWSSPVLVRPTPTLPAAVQHLSSASLLSPSSLSSSSSCSSASFSTYSSSSSPSSSSCSSASFSYSSSSSPSSSSTPATSTLTAPALPHPTASLPASYSNEPLNLATNHEQSAPRAHLKALSAFPWSRPVPYPPPRHLSPRPSEPWRPW